MILAHLSSAYERMMRGLPLTRAEEVKAESYTRLAQAQERDLEKIRCVNGERRRKSG